MSLPDLLVDPLAYPQLATLVGAALASWPEHARALAASFARRDEANLRHSERIAAMILALSQDAPGGLPQLIDDYRFLCEEIVLPEELHFRRAGKYRLSRFADALATVYGNHVYMTRYMNGLLLSDVFWVNHCRGLQHYADVFLPSLRPGADLLEIGPGHGLLLNLASQNLHLGSLSAWDVSQTSLDLSARALEVLGAKREVAFQLRNIFDDAIMSPENANRFDGVVLSEVLEHLEEPERALGVLYHLCKPGGSVWINIPANSPAPDHLFLIGKPEEAVALVAEAGFAVTACEGYAMNDLPLTRAIRQQLTITCVVTGRKPG